MAQQGTALGLKTGVLISSHAIWWKENTYPHKLFAHLLMGILASTYITRAHTHTCTQAHTVYTYTVEDAHNKSISV